MSWLDLVPVSPVAYVHDASLLCEDCGRAMATRLRDLGEPEDSGRYPDGPYPEGGGKSDVPHFCGMGASCTSRVLVHGKLGVGCPLSNPLTSHGAAEVVNAIKANLFSASKFKRKMGRLLRHVWRDYIQDSLTVAHPLWLREGLPKSLERTVLSYEREHMKTGGLPLTVLCDTESVYLAYATDRAFDIHRAAASDEGEFRRAELVIVPFAAAAGRDLVEVVGDAASEGAWE